MVNKILKNLFLVVLIFVNLFFVVKVNWDDDFWSANFDVKVSEFTWDTWMDIQDWETLEDKTNGLLNRIIEILMVAIWVISLFVVSVWAWYMIMYNWNEEFLKKWRNMVYTGFLALFIALTSYYLINLVRYILYH